jgi:hypothetical protein
MCQMTTGTMSLTQAQRAQENRAYVRLLLSRRQPAFAAALAAAERDFPCPDCPCNQRKMTAHRVTSSSRHDRGSQSTHSPFGKS